MAGRRSNRRRLGALGRLGLGGAGLAAAGLAGTTLVVLVPVERLDAEGLVIGEMPPAFGMGLLMLVVGLTVVATSLLARVVLWTRRRWTSPRS